MTLSLAIDPGDHGTGLSAYLDRDGGRGFRYAGSMDVPGQRDERGAEDCIRRLLVAAFPESSESSEDSLETPHQTPPFAPGREGGGKTGKGRGREDHASTGQFLEPVSEMTTVWVVTETWTNPAHRAAIESLSASQRTWEDAARRVFGAGGGAGCAATFSRVNSQTWQGACGMLSRTARIMGGTKDASIAVATSLIGQAPHSADEADAILLNDFFVRTGGPAGCREREEAAKARRERRKKHLDASDLDAFRGRGCL